EVLFHHRLAFLDDALDAVAVLAARLFVQALEDLLEAVDVAPRSLEMTLERVSQVGRARRLRELAERLDQLFLRVVGVAQFVQKRLVPRARICHGELLNGCWDSIVGANPHAPMIALTHCTRCTTEDE